MTEIVTPDAKIKCELCQANVHTISGHMKVCPVVIQAGTDPKQAFENYKRDFPASPLLSEWAQALIQQKMKEKELQNNIETKTNIEESEPTDQSESEIAKSESTKKTLTDDVSVAESGVVIDGKKIDNAKIKIEKNESYDIGKKVIGDAQINKDSLVSEKLPKTDPALSISYYSCVPSEYEVQEVAAYEVLGVDESLLLNARKEPIMVKFVKKNPCSEYVPTKDEKYVFNNVDLVKDVLMMLEIPKFAGYLWGHAGTGKTSVVTQIAARLNRPLIRAQHTASTEESHILGQMLAKSGSTYFEPGFLTLAMKHGWVYLADEYDFAFPQILGLYQPVLEGEALVIKEATPEWRRIEPHKYFSFIGTGNTNGSGDETGLYQGTNIQNAANFSRFSIVTQVEYMKKEKEIEMLAKATTLPEVEVAKFVDFATRIREQFQQKVISQPIGPRELIHGIKIGIYRGGDFYTGLCKAYINKLPSISAQAARELCQRIFGKGK